MNRIKNILGILTGVLMISSCVKDIIMEGQTKPQVVVSCILSNDSVQTLNLSFTKGASLSEAPPLTEAVATLYDLSLHNGMGAVGDFQRQSDGEWTLDYEAVPGHKYRLEVNVPGYEMIHAEQQMPKDSANVKVGYFSNLEYIVEPWSGWIKESDMLGWIHNKWPEDEECPKYETFYIMESKKPIWICAMNYNKETGCHEPAEYICTDAVADAIYITEKVYEPLKKDVPMPFKLSDSFSSVISSEVFYGAHQMELYPNLEGQQLYRSYIRIPEGRQIFTLSGSFTGEYYEGEYDGTLSLISPNKPKPVPVKENIENKGYICISILSDDYEKYMTESYYQRLVAESSDISTIFIRDNIFTNISGGIGILGAQLYGIYPWAPTYTYVDLGDLFDLEDEIKYIRSISIAI